MNSYIDRKYLLLLSGSLEGFTDTGNGVYNFRCPYCGDSHRNTRKRRGYAYSLKDTYLYKCHNCGKTDNLAGLLGFVSPHLAKQYKFERFVQPKLEEVQEDVTKLAFGDMSSLKRTHDPILDSLSQVKPGEDNEATRYLKGRAIPESEFSRFYWSPSLNHVMSLVPEYADRKFEHDAPCLVIPFFSEDGSTVDYIQTRSIVPNSKFFTTIKINNVVKVFGLERVNWDDVVYLFEGPFDAVFAKNGIAAAGSTSMFDVYSYVLEHYTKSKIVFVFDNDYNSNYAIYREVKRAIELGAHVVLYPEGTKWKDLNEAILNGSITGNVNHQLEQLTCQGLSAKLKFTKIVPLRKKK